MALQIEAKQPGGTWLVIDALKGTNDLIHDPKYDKQFIINEAITKLVQWSNHSSDGKGAFAGWTFRLAGSTERRQRGSKS